MIKVEDLSYSFPEKDLYKHISFTLEDGQHCAFIGSNGTGKTTLVNMIMDTEKYLYDGKILKEEGCKIGYVSQFAKRDKNQDVKVFDYLSEVFVHLQEENTRLCEEMATSEDLDAVFEEYQCVMDQMQALDADNYEVNIHRQLKVAGMTKLTELEISKLSGGEYKLLQVMKQMLLKPDLLIMDEPDVFLDFENLNGLRDLINHHKGTLLVITHNRYLLNHCFDKILHLENADIQEFDGNYTDYNFSLMQKKIELQELAAADEEEIARYQKMVDRLRNEATLMTSASRGRTVHAKQTHLDRLEARKIKQPFVELRQPDIHFPEVSVEEGQEEQVVLKVENYQVSFEDELLKEVNFEVKAQEKVAIVGPNGTGKTTLLRDIYQNANPAISFGENVNVGFLSQLHEDTLNEENTIYEEFEALGFEKKADIAAYLETYCFDVDTLGSRIEQLSGGEKNLLQLAKLSLSGANLLILDEPTSHLDTYAQMALEKALSEYKGAVLMVSHDFYTIVNCADHVLFVEDHTIRRMRVRAFRKMIYQEHFDKDYLELEQKKKELETRVEKCLQEKDFKTAKKVSEQLEEVILKM